MSDSKQATPRSELLEQLLDSRVPKNEREWAAKDEIERLRANQEDAKSAAMDLVSTLRKERDEAREAARWLLSDPAVSIYGLRADAIEDYPWLEETDE